MLKKYLFNLYKNLNLYNNFDFSEYIKQNEKNINTMFGGQQPENIEKLSNTFLDLFKNIKKQIEDIKKTQTSENSNKENIKIKLKVFDLLSGLYKNYLIKMIDERNMVEEKINKIFEITKNDKVINVLNVIENTSKIFEELLNPPPPVAPKPKLQQPQKQEQPQQEQPQQEQPQPAL
jgi:replicative superfamily II helicase